MPGSYSLQDEGSVGVTQSLHLAQGLLSDGGYNPSLQVAGLRLGTGSCHISFP